MMIPLMSHGTIPDALLSSLWSDSLGAVGEVQNRSGFQKEWDEPFKSFSDT